MTSIPIPAAAVEVAAKAAWLAGPESKHHNTWEFLEEGGSLKRVYRGIARAALEAAAPHLRAHTINVLADAMQSWAGDSERAFMQGAAEAATEQAAK